MLGRAPSARRAIPVALSTVLLAVPLAVTPTTGAVADTAARRHHARLHPRHQFQVGALNMLNALAHPRASRRVGGCRHRGDSHPCIVRRTRLQARIILGSRSKGSRLAIVSLEEVSTPQYVALKHLLPGYGFFPRNVGDYHGVALTWDARRYRMVRHGRLSGVYNNVGRRNDPPFPWVRLRSRSGSVVDVLAVHSTSTHYRNSLALQEHNAKLIRGWAKQHERRGRTAVVAGDFNNSLADPGAQRRRRGHARPSSPYCVVSYRGWLTSVGDLMRGVRPGDACAGDRRTRIWLDQVYVSHARLAVTRWVNVGPRNQSASRSPSGTDHGPVIARITPYW